ncbi:uncharacterized protein LOC123874528 isoform X2 [Maniola jurtina]|uniref:uncharacterized protein LOC123874528 isoform X2 n=1 Tax=Maniola jurtina TaxID=191418 RepID=UPI001E68626B|nr:uncharacterized protein LOC123874528 isoform X2 [Maniola jurtina]
MSIKLCCFIKKMDGLLKSQIHENCKLALPEGLKDLMSDISREVLRAQPQNLYQFITNYLGALLEARETLTIACQVCSEICKCTCDHIKPELYDELRKIGLDEENVEKAIKVIEKHLEGDQKKPAKEQSLLLKLLRKTSINEAQLPAIQQAIQKAFKRYSLSQGDLTDFRNESTMETSKATHNTLKLQKQNKPKEQKETEEIFVAPDFKPRVTTISSVSLAGSYVPLPKFRPYCAHDYEILSRISEREHVSIHYTTVANTTKTKPKKIEIKETSVIENDEKNEPFLCLDDDIHQNEDLSTDEYYVATTSTGSKLNEATTSAGLKLNRVEVNAEEMEEPDKHFVSFDDSNDEMNTEGHSDDEVQEFIENVESESDSNVSSIKEALQNDREG